MTDDRICEHGHQRRKCEICDRDDDIARLRARVAKLLQRTPRSSQCRAET